MGPDAYELGEGERVRRAASSMEVVDHGAIAAVILRHLGGHKGSVEAGMALLALLTLISAALILACFHRGGLRRSDASDATDVEQKVEQKIAPFCSAGHEKLK